MMAPYDARDRALSLRGPARDRPGAHCATRAVNWKNVGDNYSDGLHIPVAHPGLTRLFGKSYAIEAQPLGRQDVGRSRRPPLGQPVGARSTRRTCPHAPHLPESNQRLWLYYKLWPNMAFDIYPDQIDFMQWLPLTPTDDAAARDGLCAAR